jgi:hypothetical protein
MLKNGQQPKTRILDLAITDLSKAIDIIDQYDTDNALDLLKKIMRLSNINLSTVKGFYGELLVKAKLEDEGISVRHKGNQSGHDLEFELSGRNVRIDVKTSTLKSELGKKFSTVWYWGWALDSDNKKRNISCDQFICVALDKNFNVNAYYIIKAEYIRKKMFPRVGFPQFKNVSQGFVITPKGSRFPLYFKEEFLDYFQTGNQLLEKHIKVVNPNQALNMHLKKI